MIDFHIALVAAQVTAVQIMDKVRMSNPFAQCLHHKHELQHTHPLSFDCIPTGLFYKEAIYVCAAGKYTPTNQPQKSVLHQPKANAKGIGCLCL